MLYKSAALAAVLASVASAVPAPAPTFTPIPGIPGGCNPAHPGSCPSSYFTYPTITPTAAATAKATQTAAPAPAAPAPGSNPKEVPGKKWTISDLTRYCGEDNSGCDYNFAFTADGKTQRCTVIRMPGKDAQLESWSNQACDTGSDVKITWGLVGTGNDAYAVITVNKGKELAWFGVSNVNGREDAPGETCGSDDYGNLPPSQVYTY